MTPLSIEIENFRSFRARRKIEFGPPRFFAILGDTGAGKSSILEAITYALFNRSTWSGRNVKELIARGARGMSVTYRFAIGGDEFEISRVTPRGNAQPVQRLRCPARGIDVSMQSEIESAVRDALRMDAETFLHTVLLRQGMHAELLTKDPGQRDRILAELFQLDDLARIDARARSLEARADGSLAVFRGERSALGPDPQAAAAEAASALERAGARLARAEKAAGEAKLLDERLAALVTAMSRSADRAKQLRGVETLVEEIAGVEAAAARLDSAISTEEQALAAVSTARDEAQAVLARLTAAGQDAVALAKRRAALDAIGAAHQELDRSRTLLADAASSLAAAELAEDEAASEAKRLGDAASAARDAFGRMTAELEAARRREANLKSAHATLVAAQAAVHAAMGQQATKDSELGDLRAKASAAAEALIKADAEWSAARETLERERHANELATVAAHVHPGDPCPVCERPLPAEFVPPVSEDLDAAIRVERQVGAAASTRRAALQKLQGAAAQAQGAQVEAQRGVEQAEEVLRAAEAALVGLLPADRGAERAVAAAVDALERLEEGAAERLTEAERAEVARSESLVHQAAVHERGLAQREIHGALAAEEQRWHERLEVLVAQLPAEERERAAAGELYDLQAALAGASGRAAAAQRAYDDASAAVREVGERKAALVAEKADRVVAPRARAVGRASGIASSLEAEPAPREDDAVDAWVRAVVADALRERERCENEAAAAESERETLIGQRQALMERIGGEPETARTAALVDLQRADEQVRTAKDRAEKAGALEATIDRLAPAKAGLEQLRDALGARDFRAYATAQRQGRLLEVASAIFRDMRDGRYEFSPDFAILDHLTNEVRPAQTLSGGEKFLASLALSLAAVEIAANAGAKIEALFLDEGFDALDAATLPDAMLELHKRASAGRMICVITHVSEAAQFVKDAMLVRPTADGSEVVPLDAPLDEDQAAAEGLVSRMAG